MGLRKSYVWACLAMGAATGCQTELGVRPLSPTDPSPALGFNYSLPFAQYDIVIARRLSCPDENGVRVAKIATTVTATPLYSRDPAQTYAIDYTTLSSWSKTADFKIERHSNGMLKTVGVASEDRTAQIVVNVATTALKVATAVASSGVLRSSGTGDAATCSQDAIKAVDAVAAPKKALDAAKAALASDTIRMNALTAAMTGTSAKPDAETQSALRRHAYHMARSQAALNAATKEYENVLTNIVDDQKLTWPRDGNELATVTPNMLGTDKAGWFAGEAPQKSIIYLELKAPGVPSNGANVAPAPSSSPTVTAVSGVRYREPAKGQLSVCYGSPCASANPGDREVINQGPVPQLGRLYYLPFSNGAFQNNALSATFAEDGSLVNAGYAEKSSRGEVATEAMKQIASALPGALKDIRAARNDALNAETDRLKAQTTNLLAQAEYKKALAALTPSPTESLDKTKALIQSDTALKDAYRANIEARLALEKARESAGP